MTTTTKAPPAVGRHWAAAEGLEPYGGAEQLGPMIDAMAWEPIGPTVPGPVFQQAFRMGGWARQMARSEALAPVELYAVEAFKSYGPVRAYVVSDPARHASAFMVAFDVLPAGAGDVADPGPPVELEAPAAPAPVDPIGTATYNVTDDKLRFSADRRLTEDEYKACKAAGFAYWHGSKLFVSKWSPSAEAFLLERMGVELIEDDDTPDDVEARVDRFSKYKAGAERESEAAAATAHRIADGIPLGQPILVGHHSERRARRDAKRIDDAMRRAVTEGERAAYWRSRIAGAIAHAARKENPGVIARRIKGLETDERRAVKNLTPAELFAGVLHYGGDYRDGRTTYHLPRCLRSWASSWEHWQSVRDHVRMRLDYERALLAAVGGLPDAGKPWEVGGAVNLPRAARVGGDPWVRITKVNRSTFTCAAWFGEHVKWQKSEARGLMTRAEFEAYQRGEFDPDAPAEAEAVAS